MNRHSISPDEQKAIAAFFAVIAVIAGLGWCIHMGMRYIIPPYRNWADTTWNEHQRVSKMKTDVEAKAKYEASAEYKVKLLEERLRQIEAANPPKLEPVHP